jgi:hypothetical protein
MNPLAPADAPGRLGGRPLEEWNAAYTRIEGHLHALRVRNRLLVGQLVLQVLERAQRRAPREPQRSATELAAEEMDLFVTDWFGRVLDAPPEAADPHLSVRGRLALLLADMPDRWPDQFLRPGSWPPEFVTAMRETYLRAGPDFQLSRMAPRPLDLGPIATLTRFGRLPYLKMLLLWALFALVLAALFLLTHRS